MALIITFDYKLKTIYTGKFLSIEGNVLSKSQFMEPWILSIKYCDIKNDKQNKMYKRHYKELNIRLL